MGISKKVILTSSTEKFKYQARKETGAFVRTHEAGETRGKKPERKQFSDPKSKNVFEASGKPGG